jgi:hypothetical protein
MVYTQVYNASDTSAAAIDLIVGILAAIASLGTLVGLVLLYKWMTKNGGIKI